jgi:hypothetical protein
MNLNKSLIKKIDNITSLTNEFDKTFKLIQSMTENEEQNKSNIIENIYKITQLYIFLRAEHGSIIVFLNNIIDEIKSMGKEFNDAYLQKLYDLSVFKSILGNVEELINNIDMEYKKIALKYPKYINKKPLRLLLFIKNKQENVDKVDILERVKNLHPENSYKVIETKPNAKVSLKEIINKDITLKIKSLPALFIINNNNITEISSDNIINENSIISLIQ